MPTQPSLFATAPDPQLQEPPLTLMRERSVRALFPILVLPRSPRPDTRPLVEFVLEGPHGPLYRGRGRLVDRRALERDRLAPPAEQVGVELRAVVWDEEPVAGAIGSISAPWDDDEAWVFAYEVQRVVEAPAPTSEIRG